MAPTQGDDVSDDLTPTELDTTDDVDRLWRGLGAAKEAGDDRLVRAIEARMRELGATRRFAHLTDDELRAQIAGMTGNREPEGLLAYSPSAGDGGSAGAEDTLRFNQGIQANQHDRVEATLGALTDELARRQAAAEGPTAD